ncbi:hypothetical protein NX059_011387 [Plenodomus lindquistii]|nr:hypothetical protein NX059_011387 [Plenodomus lindquistii]
MASGSTGKTASISVGLKLFFGFYVISVLVVIPALFSVNDFAFNVYGLFLGVMAIALLSIYKYSVTADAMYLPIIVALVYLLGTKPDWQMERQERQIKKLLEFHEMMSLELYDLIQ